MSQTETTDEATAEEEGRDLTSLVTGHQEPPNDETQDVSSQNNKLDPQEQGTTESTDPEGEDFSSQNDRLDPQEQETNELTNPETQDVSSQKDGLDPQEHRTKEPSNPDTQQDSSQSPSPDSHDQKRVGLTDPKFHHFSSLSDLSEAMGNSEMVLHPSKSEGDTSSIMLSEWNQARTERERAYCGHCGRVVKTKVGRNLNSCCLVFSFVVLLLCPVLILFAWILLLWIDIQSHKIVCSNCEHEIGKLVPKKPRDIGNEFV